MNGHHLDDQPGDGPLAERSRLELELAETRLRIDAARQRAQAKDLETRAALRDELATTRARLAEIERRHAEAIAEIRSAADAQIERIHAEAQQRVGDLDGD